MQNTRSPLRRLTRSAAALGLAVPLTVFAVAGPAGAARIVGNGWASLHGSTQASYAGGYGGYSSGPEGYAYSGSPFGGYGSFGSGSGSVGSGSGSGQTTQATDEATSTATAAQSVGLVEITSVLDFGEAESAGTGMILSSDGTVVTNHHVVAGATSITVTDVATGKTYTARVVGADATDDVAVLKLADATGLTPVAVDEEGTGVGASVTAVGDANGDGGTLTAAAGSVKSLDSTITVQDDDGTSSTLAHEIEIAADIIPGDSGGALYNSDGKVVGMNVAASEGSAEVTGYVIPIARVESVANEILTGETSSEITYGYGAFLGVELSSASTAPLVSAVIDDSAAAKAGITAGDTVTSVGGTKVGTATGLKSAVASHQAGSQIAITWTDQSGATHSAEVTLGRAPVA
ncbi:MAG TPA: trypsin-like peptidase domain-containing protein [Marmoricola sp.]|jgi:S1-C subfamily serine protease|nr:trypsin-like peptidase domain-containing protein [Marmoricola sp.]